MSDVTAENVFLKSKETTKPITEVVIAQTEKKIDPIYAEEDSDNDSDFEEVYKITPDTHSDLKNL